MTQEVDEKLPDIPPEGGQEAEWVEEYEENRKGKALILLLLLLFLLCGVGGLFVRYILEPAPLPELIAPQVAVNYAPHYLFSIYGVDQPVGVALSPDGNRLYVAESGGERMVRVFDRDGNALDSFSPPRTGPGERSPVYMATDVEGRLFVTDRLQHAIFVYDGDGNYLDMLLGPELSLSEYVDQHVGGLKPGMTFSYNVFSNEVYYQNGSDPEQILPAPGVPGWAPLGIRIENGEQIYVTDVVENSNRVRKMALPGASDLVAWGNLNQASSAFGASGQGNGEFLFPNVAMADSQGRVYVSDGNNGRISVWDQQGNFLFNFASGNGEGAVSLPRGLYVDHRDRLFVVDAVGQQIMAYDVSGAQPVFLYSFGAFGLDDGTFNYPNDIIVDASGRLYIIDRENDRVQVWSY